MNAPNRVREFLGLESSILGLLGMVVLVGLGERMAERFLPVYLLALGGGPIAVGLLGGMDNLLSALYSFPGGYLSDRLGTKRALLLFNLFAMTGYAIVIAVPRWEAVILGAVFFLSWSAISLPASMSLVARALPRNKRAMGVSMHSLVRRLPMALGPIIGGACIDRWGEVKGIRIAFAAALVLAALAAVIQQIYISDDKVHASRIPSAQPSADKPLPESNPLHMARNMSPALRQLLTADILVRFCEQIPYAFVVVWCMQTISDPVTGVQFGILTTLEMATAVAVYIPVAYLADRGAKKPFVAATFVFFTFFPLVLMFSTSFWTLAGAFVLRGLKEFGEPTRKSLILDLCPEQHQAAMFGVYYLMRDVVVSVAAFGGAVLWSVNPQLNLLTAFGFGLLGTGWFLWKGEDLTGPAGRLRSHP